MRSEPKCVGHAEDKRKETSKGHSANERCEGCGRKKRRKGERNKKGKAIRPFGVKKRGEVLANESEDRTP